jgi:hypothetical protein
MTPRSSDDDPLEQRGEPFEGRDEQRRRAPEDPDEVAARVRAIVDAAQAAAAGILKDAEVQARRRIEGSKERAEDAAAERVEDVYSVTETLVEQARKIRERSGELVQALDDAIRRVDDGIEPGDEAADKPGDEAGDEEAHPPASPRTQSKGGESATASLAAERQRLDEMMDRVTETTERLSSRVPRRRSRKVEEEKPERPQPERPQPERPEPAKIPRKARLLATRMAVAGSSRSQISDKLRSEHGIEDAGPLLDEILGAD